MGTTATLYAVITITRRGLLDWHQMRHQNEVFALTEIIQILKERKLEHALPTPAKIPHHPQQGINQVQGPQVVNLNPTLLEVVNQLGVVQDRLRGRAVVLVEVAQVLLDQEVVREVAVAQDPQ